MMWQEMACFTGIDLHDSFVLSWNTKNNSIVLELEVSIWPGSSHYDAPKKNEYTCYKRGALRFNGASKIQGLKDCKEVTPSQDPDGSKDYGNIEHLSQTLTGYELRGEFGNVIITGSELNFEVYALSLIHI